jgi:hypothetical protein
VANSRWTCRDTGYGDQHFLISDEGEVIGQLIRYEPFDGWWVLNGSIYISLPAAKKAAERFASSKGFPTVEDESSLGGTPKEL